MTRPLLTVPYVKNGGMGIRVNVYAVLVALL